MVAAVGTTGGVAGGRILRVADMDPLGVVAVGVAGMFTGTAASSGQQEVVVQTVLELRQQQFL